MNLHEEIAKTAYELYEKSGFIKGREARNWLEAERIVLVRHASQDIEEPEGEEPLIAEGCLIEEIEEAKGAGRGKENYTTVIEAMEVHSPALGTKEDIAIKSEKVRPAKPAAAKAKKAPATKTVQKSREKRQ